MERTRKSFSSSARQRSNLPDATKAVLGDWMFHHLDFPYPTEQEKKGLMDSTMISLSQINNWFINSRARLWKPLVEKAQDIATRVEAKADRGGRVAGGGSGAASGGAGGGFAGGAGGAANGSEAPLAGGADAAAQDAAAAALKRRPRHATNPRLSPVATAILRVWLAPQLLGRSPTAAAKSQLATMTGLSPRVLERPALAKLPRGGASDSRGGSGGGRSRSNSKTDMASSSTSPRVRRSGGGSSKGGKESKGNKSKAGGKGVVGAKGKVRGSSFGGTDSLHLWESLLSTASQALHKFESTAVERKRVHSTSAADMMHFPALEGLHALRKRRCYSLAEDSPTSSIVDADLGGSMNTKRMRSASESSIFLPLPSRQSSRRSSFVPAEVRARLCGVCDCKRVRSQRGAAAPHSTRTYYVGRIHLPLVVWSAVSSFPFSVVSYSLFSTCLWRYHVPPPSSLLLPPPPPSSSPFLNAVSYSNNTSSIVSCEIIVWRYPDSAHPFPLHCRPSTICSDR